MSTRIRFGHSPDPDDAFMFYAIAKKKIDLRNFEVIHVVEDIESLNQRALRAELEVTAVSVHAYAYIHKQYAIMRSGASMGKKYGPIVVSQSPIKSLEGKKVAIPGMLTTAYLALKLFEPDFSYVIVPFDKIFDYVKAGKADCGLIIHEGQITYENLGFNRIVDLGQWWWDQTELPLPLGVDVIKKDLGREKIREFSAVFKESVAHSLKYRNDALHYALPFGRGISWQEGDQFVGMYVNDYTVDLGKEGEEAVRLLLARGFEEKILPEKIDPEFV